MTKKMKLFWRVHGNCPEFSSENASSAPWGAEWEPCPCGGNRQDCPHCDGEGERRVVRDVGYSCCECPEDLIAYFESRGGAEDDTPVVAFSGARVGTGPDNEPLVVPDMEKVEWMTWKELVEKYS